MPTDPALGSSAAPTPATGPPEAADGAEVFECYCGLGAECPMYGQMTASQRADCSCDKRLTAQWMYINGMTR